ncbi:vacuolar protein sorting-associated protein 37a isoform x2 [Stylonychia lemnae]|uniref:Vacuolar protein sorting-associated protein 37a isoform x2 n=1 Tax=Stylonychia lemnae TaxID=5949 RepID=A0A078AIQ7_STYLE|nr:vacuolar protein sorting-associated protein 37a isoform x2 [Stylonychia lemnae]|eukprot:CDW82104.1 vacuolar protein sorting-associated protein 37a isoform x2 [Stylonychia lemnae]
MYARSSSNYDMMSKSVPQQTQIQQQQNMLHGMKNVQLQNLMKAYPGTISQMKTDSIDEYRVPLQLKVGLNNDFPITKPSIRIMSKVSHPEIDSNTFYYQGAILQNWTENSSLAHLVQSIHESFNLNPPIPANMQGVIQKSQYQPEQINIQKPLFINTKNQAKEMSSVEQENLLASKDSLLNFMLIDPETEPIKTELDKHMKEKGELQELAQQYETKYVQFLSLKQQNDQLSYQEQNIMNKMSKQKVISVIDKKISNADNESKQMEKQFYKGSIDQRNFIDGFLAKRKDFHRYQILKVKVNQA